jgi:hypothetical protein
MKKDRTHEGWRRRAGKAGQGTGRQNGWAEKRGQRKQARIQEDRTHTGWIKERRLHTKEGRTQKAGHRRAKHRRAREKKADKTGLHGGEGHRQAGQRNADKTGQDKTGRAQDERTQVRKKIEGIYVNQGQTQESRAQTAGQDIEGYM